MKEGGRVLKLFDQYIDEYIPVVNSPSGDELGFLKKYSGGKNIVYLNSPPKIERFAGSLSRENDFLDNEELLSACDDISKFLHKDYGLLDCIRRGVVYHHGSVPDVVRLYVEHLYSTMPGIKYVVSSSTLLEGVNIPAEKLFLFECSKGRGFLSASHFKNLVGRICRFREVFSSEGGSLGMLEPEVYVVASKYMQSNANIENFIRDRVKVDKKIEDKLENVLLEAVVITDDNRYEVERSNEILENLEPGITGAETGYAETEVGRFCYANNVTEIDILAREYDIESSLKDLGLYEDKIDDTEKLMDAIHVGFIANIEEGRHRQLERLSQDSAKRFYRMFIGWRMRNASYSEMIKRFLDYWDSIDDPLVYVHKWGDTARPEYYVEHWVNIKDKSRKERVNLAIVRIKEEQDFLDNQVIKFVEILNDLELLGDEFYEKIKYGTTDQVKITMMKNGFSAGLTSLLSQKYARYLDVNIEENTVHLSGSVLSDMRYNNENRLYVFEAGFYANK